MSKQEITKDLIDRLKKIEGSCRGVSLQTPLEYVRSVAGNETVQAAEKELKKLGLPTLKEIRVMEHYPVGWMTIVHLVIKKTLNWNDEEIKKMGNALPKFSFIVNLLIKYFLSPRKSFEASADYWNKHFTVGKLEPIEFNEEKKYIVLRLKNYKTHPIDCKLFEGYFTRIAQYVIKSEKITIEETKCMFKGDPYHEFVIRWE